MATQDLYLIEHEFNMVMETSEGISIELIKSLPCIRDFQYLGCGGSISASFLCDSPCVWHHLVLLRNKILQINHSSCGVLSWLYFHDGMILIHKAGLFLRIFNQT